MTADGCRGKESLCPHAPVDSLEALSGLSGFKKESTNLGSERGVRVYGEGGKEGRGGLGQNIRHFSKNSFCLKCSHSAFYRREEAHPTRKNQIYHSGNHVIVMTTFKEPTQSLFCKALMLMPIIQAWVGLRNLPLPDCIPTYSQQRTPTDNVLWFHCSRETSSIFLPYTSPDSLGFN